MGVLDLMSYVQKQGDMGRERGQQTRLGQLAGQSYSAPEADRGNLLSQMAQINPEFAQQQQTQMQGQDDRIKTKAKGAASYMLEAYNSKDPARIQGAYQAVRPFLEEVGRAQGKVPPPEFSEDMLAGMYQIVGEGGGVSTEGDTIQSQKVSEDGYIVNTYRNGRMEKTGQKVDRQMWFRDNPGMPPTLVTKDATELQVGGGGYQQPQQPAPQPTAPPRAGTTAESDGVAGRLNQYRDTLMAAGLQGPQLDAALQAAEQTLLQAEPHAAPQQAPAMQQPQQYGGARARPSEAQTAAEVADAKARTELQYLPAQEGIKTAAEVERERLKGQVQAERELAGKDQGRTRDADITLSLLDEAKAILPSATGGLAGAGTDMAAGAFGISTKGAKSTARLKLISAQLISKVPRFEGPQSNFDVQFYREAAGDLANDRLPVATRMAALETMVSLNQKYATPQGGDSGRSNAIQTGSTPKRRKYNPTTGRLE